MSNETEILLEFIGIGLGFKRSYHSLDNNILARVLNLALEQGVIGFAFDGFKAIRGEQRVDDILLMKFFGYSQLIDKKNEQYIDTARKLADYWANHGIRTVVLKGLAYSRYYPNPLHRPSSDFDCYLYSDQEKGNLLVEELGVVVDRSYYKNSKFCYEGLTVENHSFTTQIGGMKGSRELESYLINLLKNEPLEKDANSHLYFPSPLFNALHMMRHAQCHFLREGFSLKFVSDWLMFQEANNGKYDELEFYRICEKYGMSKFVTSMNHLADLIKGTCQFCDLNHFDMRLLDYIFSPDQNDGKSESEQRWNIIKNTLRSGWKYKLFANQSQISWLIRSAWEYLFVKTPKA